LEQTVIHSETNIFPQQQHCVSMAV